MQNSEFRIMHFDFLKIETQDLAKLSFYVARQKEKPLWRDLIGNSQKTSRLDLESPATISKFSKLINRSSFNE